VADDILLGEEYENMTTADAKVRALPGSAVTVEIVQAPSKDGSLLVSEDGNNTIWRITYKK
jgi:glucose/arabinose dehydrogenase